MNGLVGGVGPEQSQPEPYGVGARGAADGGAVWRSPDGRLFKRTGGPELLEEAELLSKDLLALIDHITDAGHADLFGVTGSFLVGCFNTRSDIDLLCYGTAGYDAARRLFKTKRLIRPYAGDDLMRLYLRRAKYMEGSGFDALIRQEQRKFQGLTATAGGAHQLRAAPGR
ncbi:hypothetical protein AB0G77_33465 [Streptomyces hygroscopicus]|uniref:hypothetical protein n=1 Tax=Streptomyces hygroscopicus TaxID=1912 RepID=UPI0033C56168